MAIANENVGHHLAGGYVFCQPSLVEHVKLTLIIRGKQLGAQAKHAPILRATTRSNLPTQMGRH